MLILFAAIVDVAVGALIWWSNPARLVNRLILTCSLHIAAWLFLLYMAVPSPTHAGGLVWLKIACAVSAAVPFHFWLVKESIAGDLERTTQRSWLRMIPWLVFCGALASIVFTEYFIPSHSTDARRVYGWGYYGFMGSVTAAYLYILQDAYRRTKTLTGGQRLELQVWLGGGCATAGGILTLMLLNALTHDPAYVRIQPLAILIFYAGTAVAITMHRIFDARQILRITIEKTTLVLLVSAAGYWLYRWLHVLMPSPFDFVVTVALALWFTAVVSGLLDRTFRFYRRASAARQAAFTIAQRETRVDRLETAFSEVLKGWGQTERVLILSGAKGAFTGHGLTLPHDSTVAVVMRELRWATPERLARERRTPQRRVLAEFLAEHGLGVLVLGEGPTLGVLVGVGMGAARRPYTFPQVTELVEFASIIQGSLERANFAVKAQHAEQLATVGLLGASLAHEIRNPLVSIKTFVQLLPAHYQDPRFRDKFFRLIADEVDRIDRLTEQLLDLASPRTYAAGLVDLHPVLTATIDLVGTKAAHRAVEIVTEFGASPATVYTDAGAAKQVMLNLCFNAIQALDGTDEGARRIWIRTRNVERGIEVAVTDNGPGLAPEIIPRLFQPFQTTKSSGFGLGLAICSDILANLSASISADPPQPGAGATFRVTFPCQPSSS